MVYLFVFLFSSELLMISNALNTITSTSFLKDPASTIISNNGVFNLGFFSPKNTSHRYVGIWYNNVSPTNGGVIWVANRDVPNNDTNGTLEISNDGNLVIFSGKKRIIWSSNLSSHDNNNASFKCACATIRYR